MIVLTTFGRGGYLRRAMEAGARGFVVKDAPPKVLADTIRKVMAGEHVVDPALAALTLAAGDSPLTHRERDVLSVARSGATVAEIATKLYLSEGTVRNYLSSAIAKTSARNRLEALRVADERGWLQTASFVQSVFRRYKYVRLKNARLMAVDGPHSFLAEAGTLADRDHLHDQ